MTGKFGRTTPSQFLMLALAGIDDSINLVEFEPSDEERMKMMLLGRKLLQKMTGKDFGFDLANWRDFLMASDENDEFGYKHPYAFEQVDEAIQLAILDTNRRRLLEVRERQAHELLNMLLKSPVITFSNESVGDIPEIGGVYRIIETVSKEKNSIYIGQSKNIQSHLMGKKTKSILERISREKEITSFAVQFIQLNEAERDWFEQFAIEKLTPFIYELTPT